MTTRDCAVQYGTFRLIGRPKTRLLAVASSFQAVAVTLESSRPLVDHGLGNHVCPCTNKVTSDAAMQS